MRNATTRLTVLVALLTFLDLALWLLIVPLLPSLEDDAGLSKGEAGIVLGAYSAAVLLASMPVGYLADRFGPRRITVASAFLFAALAPALAIADDFPELVAVRFGQGLFSAVSWTAGLAWLTASVPAAQRGRSLATISAAASFAPLAGPVLGGPVVSMAGLGPTLVAFAGMVLAVAVWALFEPGHAAAAGPAVAEAPARARRSVMRAALGEPLLRASLVSITLAASTAGVIQLLFPLHLDEEGVSESAIGWILTLAAGVGLCVTLALRRVADRIDRLRTVAVGVAATSIIVSLFVLDPPVPAYVAILIAVQTAQAPIWVLSYPLCADGAERAGVGRGVAMGALNTVWAIGALASPAAAGLIAEAAGDGLAYALAVVVLLAGLVLLVQAARSQAQPGRRLASSSGDVTGRRQAKRSHT